VVGYHHPHCKALGGLQEIECFLSMRDYCNEKTGSIQDGFARRSLYGVVIHQQNVYSHPEISIHHMKNRPRLSI
jgi:hypothetical protein